MKLTTTAVLGFLFWLWFQAPSRGAPVPFIRLALVAWVSVAVFAVFQMVPKGSPGLVRFTVAAFATLLGADGILGLWPKTRAEIIAEMRRMIDQKEWPELDDRIAELETNPSMKDVALYFRGARLHNTRPRQIDPEQVLSLIPPDSDLFSPALELRLSNWSQSSEQVISAARIADSMERVNAKYAMYYRLRLVNQYHRYRDVATLYDEFRARHAGLFDFEGMNPGRLGDAVEGRPYYLDMNEHYRVTAVVVLFLVRLAETAHADCLDTEKADALQTFERLAKYGNRNFNFALRMLAIPPGIQSVPGHLKGQMLPCSTTKSRRQRQ